MSKEDLAKKVGEFVSPVHTVIRVDQTVDQALVTIRAHRTDEKIFYFYVVDSDFHLMGILSTRALLLSAPEKMIEEIMEHRVIDISTDHTLKEALEKLSSHRLLALPVVNGDRRLLGIIDIQFYLDEAVDIAKARRSSTDLFQVLGLKLEEGKKPTVWSSYRIRMPWIFCNMFGGIACAIIARFFELVLAKVLLLAMFIPLVLSLSESVSMQSMTYSLQLLHRPHISWKRILYRMATEWRMVLLLGLTSGVTVGLLSLFWGEGLKPAVTLASGIFISITASATVGAAIPLFLHSRKLDPKVAAGPVVLTFADMITTLVYLSLATWWLL